MRWKVEEEYLIILGYFMKKNLVIITLVFVAGGIVGFLLYPWFSVSLFQTKAANRCQVATSEAIRAQKIYYRSRTPENLDNFSAAYNNYNLVCWGIVTA